MREYPHQFTTLDDEGRSTAEIASIMGVSMRTVTRWRGQTGRNKARAPERLPDDVRARARQIIEDGAPFAEAARTVGVTPHTIRRWFPDLPAYDKYQAAQCAVMGQIAAKVLA